MAYIEVVNWIGAHGSIIGAIVSIFLIRETHKIRKSFLCKARLPQVCAELRSDISNLPKELPDWENNSKSVYHTLSKIKGTLHNLKKKLPRSEKKQVSILLKQFGPRNKFFKIRKISELSSNECWDIYNSLCSFDAELKHLQKDVVWE